MTDYFQYVHNLKGQSRFDHLKPSAREAITSLFLQPLEDYNTLEKIIIEETDIKALEYISSRIDLKVNYNNTIVSSSCSSYVEGIDFDDLHAVINLRKINNIQRPNKLFRAVNNLLPVGGFFIGQIETYGDRKRKFFRRYGKFLGQLIWLLDFLINRVIPRFYVVDKIYFWITKGRLHCMSIAELLGRLVYCGFQILDFNTINGVTYFISKKSGPPIKTCTSKYHPVIGLPRIGMGGKQIFVYKIRTMHPYSEFIQDYVIMKNGYDENGKPAKDFRITRSGILLRKYWLDELPQLINVLRGEMKLVGVRPLSKVRLNEFPEDLKHDRLLYKPGCIAPYVSLRMPGEKSRIEAERKYLNDLQKNPRTTDFIYFIKALFNILTSKIKSK